METSDVPTAAAIARFAKLRVGFRYGQNLTNVVNLIDFGGLFSGNAIGRSRNFALCFTTTF